MKRPGLMTEAEIRDEIHANSTRPAPATETDRAIRNERQDALSGELRFRVEARHAAQRIYDRAIRRYTDDPTDERHEVVRAAHQTWMEAQ